MAPNPTVQRFMNKLAQPGAQPQAALPTGDEESLETAADDESAEGAGGTTAFARGGSVGTKAYQAGGYVSGDTGNSDPSDQTADVTPGDAPTPDAQASAIPDDPSADPTAGGDQSPDATGPDPDSLSQAQPDPQALMQYASGADAVGPDEAQAMEQQVDPNGDLTPQERAIRAIANAAQSGNKQKAWGLMQHHRKAYNVKRHAARAALASGNKREAVRLANSALGHVPNGMHVHLTPHATGVHVAFHRFAGHKAGK